MMRSATAFLPDNMTTFMNLASSTLPNLGSGRISRLGTSRRRGILKLPCDSSVEPLLAASAIYKEMTTYLPWANPRPHHYDWSGQPNENLSFLGALGTVLGTRLLAVFHALQVERATHDVVANTGQILDTTAAHQNYRVLLQVVAF